MIINWNLFLDWTEVHKKINLLGCIPVNLNSLQENIILLLKCDLPMYSNSSLSAIPLWLWHCLQMRANLLEGPSPTRYSTTLSMYPLSRGSTGLGKGGPGALRWLGPIGWPISWRPPPWAMGEDGATRDLSMEVGRWPSPPDSVLLGEAVNAICCRLTEAFRLSLVVEGRLDGGGLHVLSPMHLFIFSQLIVLEEQVKWILLITGLQNFRIFYTNFSCF